MIFNLNFKKNEGVWGEFHEIGLFFRSERYVANFDVHFANFPALSGENGKLPKQNFDYFFILSTCSFISHDPHGDY